ncbi:MAG TPA: SMP-30/gluconolactonase/LRE family protein [Pseudonocardia sp.]|jgi:gluconolactonase
MKLLADGYGLLEAARWYRGQGLLFSDMTGGGVYRLADEASAPQLLIPHRKGIGGLVAHRDGGLVVAGRNVAHKSGSGATSVIRETRPDETFFNDLTADHLGRLYVGSVAVDPTAGDGARRAGRLYRLNLDGSTEVLADDVLVSNGLGADPTDRLLYHVDSPRRTVWCYPIGAEGGERREFVQTAEYSGVPDGLAVAADGSVWVAMAGGAVVVGWDDSGRRIAEIAVGQELVTSVCFGGSDGQTLFILTGCNDEYPDAQGGSVYALRGDRRGAPGVRAAIPIHTSRSLD